MDRLHKPVNADCPPLYKPPKSFKVKPLQEIYTAIAGFARKSLFDSVISAGAYST